MGLVRLLIVDDYAPIRELIAEILADQSDFQIVGEASDGLEAYKKAEALRPDLILMDWNMPRCDGLQATRKIKQALPNVNIILLTIALTDWQRSQAIVYGAQGCLDKGSGFADLLEILYQLKANSNSQIC